MMQEMADDPRNLVRWREDPGRLPNPPSSEGVRPGGGRVQCIHAHIIRTYVSTDGCEEVERRESPAIGDLMHSRRQQSPLRRIDVATESIWPANVDGWNAHNRNGNIVNLHL